MYSASSNLTPSSLNLTPDSLRLTPSSKIFIAGHNGMVGSAIWRILESKGYTNLIGRSSKELDLRNQAQVEAFFEKEKPDYVFLAAAKVGGILANDTYRAEFIYDNLQIQNNVIHQSYVQGVKKLLFLGSSCIYPRDCPQPMKEEYLLTGELEQTNEPYAIAKIAGIKMCESYNRQYGTNFISVMPTNLYGPGDNYDLETSHVLPALLRKFHEGKVSGAKYVEVWGRGNPKREFLYVNDMADACIFLMTNFEDRELYSMGITFVNIGSGHDLSIKELAITIGDVVGYKGEIKFDMIKPDGTPRKLLDVSLLNKLGWKYSVDLKTGLKSTYDLYIKK
ncbi:MAG: GDP-L-fucose synthase [Candidatus Marinimicrobia bacterium]|nr:GDP-L-fucose synthase [Candidatus Neomarinimicrobiota bacterium]